MPIAYLEPMASFPQPPDWYTKWEDFDDEYTLTAAASPWIGTALASGTGVMTADEQYGVLTLSGNATSDNSGYQLQADMENFALVTGKRSRFAARFKLSDATNSHFFVGASITDTTICDGADGIAGLTPTDCVGFYKADDAATIAIVVKRDSAVVCNSTLATLSDDTYYWVMFEVEMTDTAGKGNVSAWVFNGTTGALIATSGPISSTTLPYSTEEILAPAVALVSGNATGTKTASVDCIGWQVQR